MQLATIRCHKKCQTSTNGHLSSKASAISLQRPELLPWPCADSYTYWNLPTMATSLQRLSTGMLIFLFAGLFVFFTSINLYFYLSKELAVNWSAHLKPCSCLLWLVKSICIICWHLERRFSMHPVKHCKENHTYNVSQEFQLKSFISTWLLKARLS